MPIQQKISNDLLFIKHRKLYYLLTSYDSSIVYKISQRLGIKETTAIKELLEQISNQLTIVQGQFYNNQNEKKIAKQNFPLYGKIYNGYQLEDLRSVDYTDKIQCQFALKKLEQQDIRTIKYKDQYNIYENVDFNDKNNTNRSQDFNFGQNYLTRKFLVQYDKTQQIFNDYDNYMLLNNKDYYFKLYIGDRFLQQCKNLQFQGVVSKDIIFNGCQSGEIYLKLYDKNNNFIKTFSIRKTTQFDFQINKDTIVIGQDNIRFESNVSYLKGYNIYHGNSICQKYHCNLYHNNVVFSKPIDYQIIGCGNIDSSIFITLFNNSYVILRFKFKKIVYVKDVKINTNISSNQYNLKIRYGTVPQALNTQNFINYKNDYYCNVLDIRIQYTGFNVFQINSLDFYVYDLSQEDVIYSDYIVFNKQNNIFITKQSMVNGQVFQQYPNYITTKDNSTSIIYNNINFQKSDFFSTQNQQQQGSIQFALKSKAISGDINTGGNNFRYLYAQYWIQDKKDTSLFDLKYFKINNKKYNFPVYLILQLSDGVKRLFKHQPAYIVDGIYIERWNCIGIIISGNYETEDQRTVDRTCRQDYFYFSYHKILTSLVDQWKTNIFIKVGSQYNQYQMDMVSFIDNNQTNGFNIGAVYMFYKRPTVQPILKLYTKSYNQPTYQYMATNMFNVTSTSKRDFKITIQDGDNKRIKLYTIIFQNYNKAQVSSFNMFEQKNKQRIQLKGNNTRSQNGIIKNNFYNVMYSLNYYYKSPLTGVIIQGDRSYFDACKIQEYNKTNLHFTWQKNDLFQYIVLFDQFKKNQYTTYFIPFANYQLIKAPNTYTGYSIDQNTVYKQFYYQFDNPQIISGFNIQRKFSIHQSVKFDYFYKYSNDNIDWTQFQYYNPFQCFYAKYLIIKCIIKDYQHSYCDTDFILTISYFDSTKYFLTSQNYFDSIMITDFQPNKTYMFMMRKYYNGQFFDSTLKLFKILSCVKNEPITQIYVDNHLIQQNPIKLSGIDNYVSLKFQLPLQSSYDNLNRNTVKFNIRLYCEDILIDDLYVFIQNDENGFYNYEYCIKDVYLKPFNKFSYKVLYFDEENNISQFSNLIYFYFNHIPTVPQKLWIIDCQTISETSSSSSSYDGEL